MIDTVIYDYPKPSRIPHFFCTISRKEPGKNTTEPPLIPGVHGVHESSTKRAQASWTDKAWAKDIQHLAKQIFIYDL